ncbi:MAG: hemerythrin [Desulfobulbus sp.]|nr:MAG: hemerythrin [Desulfobulbus sp.]
MALIQWNDSLSVNIAEIDQQHRKLISLINDLNEAMSKGQGRTVVGKIIQGLTEYTKSHFALEERYFVAFNYPETSRHKKEHAEFIAKVSEFRDEYEKGRLALSIDVMNYLSDWLRHHIKGVDKKYSAFFNERGLK